MESAALAGRVIAGRYEIVELLGEGGFAAVWKARQFQPNRLVAVKILHPEHAEVPENVEEFLNEAQLYVRLGTQDANIATIIECGHDAENDLYFLVMTLLGETVTDLLSRQGVFSPEQCIRIAEDVGRALRSVHAAHLVHRDVKCSNIMTVPGKDLFVLTDFGIGLVMEEVERTQRLQESGSPRVTDGAHAPRTKKFENVGTWSYASPEQCGARSKREIGPQSDFYSLGVVLFRVATGQFPFPPHLPSVIADHIAAPPPDPRTLRPELPVALSELILRALRKRPEDRFASADAFVEAATKARLAIVAEAASERALASAADAMTQPRSTPADEAVMPPHEVPASVAPTPTRPEPLRNVPSVDESNRRAESGGREPKSGLAARAALAAGIAIVLLAGATGFWIWSHRISLEIVTMPSDAHFTLVDLRAANPDGGSRGIVVTGRSPQPIRSLKSGRYLLTLKKDGYFARRDTLDLPIANSGAPQFVLEKMLVLAVETEPAEARVRLEPLGEESTSAWQTTPHTFGQLHAAPHRLLIEKTGYSTVIDTIAVDSAASRFALVLQPEATSMRNDGPNVGQDSTARKKFRTFAISVAPEEAQVLIDGVPLQDQHSTPSPWSIRLSEGEHSFQLVRGSPSRVDVTLHYTVLHDGVGTRLILDWRRNEVIER